MKDLTWRSVSGGIAAFAAILVLLLVVLKYARTGAPRGDKFTLYVAVADATNLLAGSEVWLNGRRVGTVKNIAFAPASAPTDQRVIIETEILSRVRDQIRDNSRASLRSGGSVIGAPVVFLTSGTVAARAVSPGDTLRGVGKSDLEIAASQATGALEEVPAIFADAKSIMANARSAGARLNAIMDQDRARGSFGERASSLKRALANGNGSAGKLMRDEEIRRRVSRTMAATDTLRTLLASRSAELGRFRRDSTLIKSVETLRSDVAILRELAASPQGTVGRITSDSALVRGLDSLFAELTALFADMRKNPLRYARVF